MSVSAVSTSGFSIIAAGLRNELRVSQFRQALEAFGLLDGPMDASLRAVEAQSRAIREVGVAKLRADTIGLLIDLLA